MKLTTIPSKDSASLAVAKKNNASTPDVARETLESLAVAFILALMFKAFIAEAFIIPTGSMAPTLMGAHKDVVCNDCGYQYQCGASFEFNDVGAKSGKMVFGTICPLCRKPQVLDLLENANHRTFSGDRILVSKLAYVFSKPRRWDVFVFKYPDDARLNYIKRCLGTSNETIRIEHGDVYFSKERPAASFEIARKPPHVIQSMLQPLSDTHYPAKSLIQANAPDAWQSAESGSNNWKIGYVEGKWSASIQGVPSGNLAMIRYRHRVLDPQQWMSLRTHKTLPTPLASDSYRLVTDFTAYNYGIFFASKMEGVPVNYDKIAQAELDKAMVGRLDPINIEPSRNWENDGMHWTGDLSGEWEFTTEPATETLRLLVVEAGVEHRCDIDLKTGVATATLMYEDKPLVAFESGSGSWVESIQVKTSIRAGAKHRVQLANIDDSLTLWVDGSPVSWGNQGRFSIRAAVPDFQHAPRTKKNNPLDAAPVAMGVQGGGCTITHARVARDVYYIAHSVNNEMSDYSRVTEVLADAADDRIRNQYALTNHGETANEYGAQTSRNAWNRNAVMSSIDAWSGSPLDTERRAVTFELEDRAYFPMGDNSSSSADARSWNRHFVPERLMIGRAVLVFWPHWWNAPIPFLPNFQRMGLIR
jgi:signal peptidase I